MLKGDQGVNSVTRVPCLTCTQIEGIFETFMPLTLPNIDINEHFWYSSQLIYTEF